ncbi:MAG TPA: alanine--glyoxylate aminotransferase family protein [Methanoregulaceae archaeon]|jgi:aspartate aminotransferase-like enzyme|nr:alanine--glyoxylate aminotransferase family protein [Methanolinea sp.]MCC7566784.1 alanine--glyoxylate aminotransferase family protein [Methanoregulaceae archaeon]HOP66113.1 alanine--glyoxylate aminotransferase family protein [Methanoregulaceae archaeon]HPJ73502.1 alanine--glyoxylate aminotransferase family protein [Methanoregulaceae archaeon]HPQ75072.1 alanine--glyoxylate aminotransferase family protein [Methanoregulaceae archaeon]
MENEPLLMLPGPVPIPERVRAVMMRQAINHRGDEFGSVYADCTRVLKTAFGTASDLFVISGSGTAAMEAAVANFGRERKIACLVNGKFGDRLFRISQRYGSASPIASEWGTPLDLVALESALESGAEMVTLVHNETSAGIRNPAEKVGILARKYDALFVMDGITSIAGDEVYADKWGADVVVVGSQKCLAAPAGLSAISVSDRAWERIADHRPFYLDLAAYRKSAGAKSMQTPYTPAVPLFLALREACMIIEEEGLDNRIARHRTLANAVRAAVDAWGLSMFPEIDADHAYSNTASAVSLPEGVLDSAFRGLVKEMGIEIAGGQDHLKGRIFRIGTMGAVGAPEILATLSAVQYSLQRCGYTPAGDGVMAAAGVLG